MYVNSELRTVNFYTDMASDKASRCDYESNAGIMFSLPTADTNRIGSIDDDGFTINKVSYSGATIEYTAYK